jgi:hypothetical protein
MCTAFSKSNLQDGARMTLASTARHRDYSYPAIDADLTDTEALAKSTDFMGPPWTAATSPDEPSGGGGGVSAEQWAASAHTPASRGLLQFHIALEESDFFHCPGRPGRLSGLRVFHSKSVLYGTFVWASRAFNNQK